MVEDVSLEEIRTPTEPLWPGHVEGEQEHVLVLHGRLLVVVGHPPPLADLGPDSALVGTVGRDHVHTLLEMGRVGPRVLAEVGLEHDVGVDVRDRRRHGRRSRIAAERNGDSP